MLAVARQLARHLNKNNRRQKDNGKEDGEKALKDVNENTKSVVGGWMDKWMEGQFCLTDLCAEHIFSLHHCFLHCHSSPHTAVLHKRQRFIH